ncbi:STAS domain-containing protein [Rhizobium sp. KAs_5_22]|uniref:STAS domain-containing protein n=1 Tax=Ciceribacter selenitireducens TaxID=448181 RepID=UPI0005678E37|nr:STAS domain-containing protein [Ciceribacter selenitireducens]PPJ49355.1 STAS domain-containing protein [Rhizobium sp. KAs_5_22]
MLNGDLDSIVVKLEDATNIRNISKFYPEILTALSGTKPVVLDLPGEPEVDLSFVQLVESARLYAGAHGKALTLAQPASGPLLGVLGRAGFIENASHEDAQFWLHKGSVQ